MKFKVSILKTHPGGRVSRHYHCRNVDFEYSPRNTRIRLGSPRQYVIKSKSSNYTANAYGDLAIKSVFVNIVSSAILNSQEGYRCTLVPRLPFPVPRSPFPVPRSPFPVPRSPFPVPRSPFPVPRSPFPVPRSPFPVPRFPFPVPRSPFPVPRSPFPVPRSPFPKRSAASGDENVRLWKFSVSTGAFHSTKNSGMKFRVFHVTNGTVFSGYSDFPEF